MNESQILMLDALVAEARGLANDHPCARGHVWESDAGRRCPNGDDDGCPHGHSQAVYRCVRCGEWDYGYERDGPGYADCQDVCGVRI